MTAESTRDPKPLDAAARPAAPSRAGRWAFWRERAISIVPAFVATAVLARAAIAGIFEKVGHPGAPLDDSYIHFQYARAIAEGHPLRFQAGEAITSGATSALWPALLAPFYAIGFRGEAILWPAWALSFLALGLLAVDTFHLTKRLTGRAIALGAAAMVLAFGGFVWSAASGMEVVPFAWALARTARRASEWVERGAAARTRRHAGELVALAWVTALLRPEGAISALFVAITLIASPRAMPGASTSASTASWGKVRARARALGLAAAAAALATPLLLRLTTGSLKSNTTVAKLMIGNPYYQGDALIAAALANARTLVGTLLNGEVWSAEFIPHGGAPVAVAGLVALAIVGWRSHSRFRALAILLIALTMFAPCFYITFLWNRLRYLWPFATGWFIGIACLARLASDVCGSIRPRWRLVGPLACGGFAGMLASRLEWVLDDVAQSASGIDRQQVALGQWAKESLPEGARVGVNDTGAIAYFSDRHTFDVVGLTTDSEARYWVAGPGSRLEHYERLQKSAPEKLPTHFIVYPEWMGLDFILGEHLHEATVTDATILGGQTMRAYVADYSLLGSGELPWTETAGGGIVDAIDVADLDSEAEHRYELLGARDNEEAARRGVAPDGEMVVDGGRANRTRERFVAKLRPGVAARGVVRLEASSDAQVHVTANGASVGWFRVEAGEWQECAFEVPADAARAETQMQLTVDGDETLSVYHYWFTRSVH